MPQHGLLPVTCWASSPKVLFWFPSDSLGEVCPRGSSSIIAWEMGDSCSQRAALSAQCHLTLLPEVTSTWVAEGSC